MKYYCLILTLISTPLWATTWQWTDCSKPLYAYPFGLDETDLMIRYINDEIVVNHAESTHDRKRNFKQQIGPNPLEGADTSKLSDQELKSRLADAFIYLEGLKEWSEMRHYSSIKETRFDIVYKLFIESAESVVEEMGVEANFMNASFSSCPLDQAIMEGAIKRTFEKASKLKNRIPPEQSETGRI